ncbi:VWA domain-containing protein [Enterococcus sp. DIV0840c]|jgi:LPXTG-motif cell wall-anchored protein|uniref:VWA domain-containing protein n=1 Tax=Enterococcus sp. DIV0840c TaxID=2774772 RepID=UPI003D277130
MKHKRGWQKYTGIFFLLLMGVLMGSLTVNSETTTYDFDYQTDATGQYLTNGTAQGDTYNYKYGQAPGVAFDEENYVNYADEAYLKKSVKEAAGQGLFDVTLAVKGNQTSTPVDLVMVIDYSSSMTGEKLTNALLGLQQFGNELADSLANGSIRIGIVAYNREVYTTNGFSTDIAYLEQFLRETAESHSGTFMQKGLLAGQQLLLEESRPEAEKLFIHIGDDSANRSYLPVDEAAVYQNTGAISDYNGYHTESYIEEFQTSATAYHTTSKNPSDSQAIPVSNTVVTDETLGTIVALKKSGFTYYSVATAPSARGEYIGRNLASAPSNYLTTDENLSGLGSALTEIANHIDKTIPDGTITDPMGEGILLQGAGNFDADQYQLVGWRKNAQGEWVEAPEVATGVTVSEKDQTITVSGIALGENEKLTLTYQVRLNTEAPDFKGEAWVLCNGRTTLTPASDDEALDFPIPSIKAPNVSLAVLKKWVNVSAAEIPDQIDYQVKRTTTTAADSWQQSDRLTLEKANDFQASLTKIPVAGQMADLPKYNNQGEDFVYQVEEVNIPDGFESSVTTEGDTLVITNTKKETEPSTTEPSTTEPSTTEPSTTEPSTTEPSTTEPSTTEPSTTEPSTTEPSTTEPSTTEPSTTEPSTTEPSTTEPSTTEPSTTDPSTTEPSTTEPSTTEPSTTEPSITESSTTEPSTTEPSTTEPSTTEPSTTEPSTTEPSTTEPSTPEPSTTEPSIAEPSTTTTNHDGATLVNPHESQSTETSASSETTKSSSQEKAKALPKTNEQRAAWLVILGAIMVGGVFTSVLKRK